VLGGLNLAEEMLLPNLPEAEAGLLGVGLLGNRSLERTNTAGMVFKAADGQKPLRRDRLCD